MFCRMKSEVLLCVPKSYSFRKISPSHFRWSNSFVLGKTFCNMRPSSLWQGRNIFPCVGVFHGKDKISGFPFIKHLFFDCVSSILPLKSCLRWHPRRSFLGRYLSTSGKCFGQFPYLKSGYFLSSWHHQRTWHEFQSKHSQSTSHIQTRPHHTKCKIWPWTSLEILNVFDTFVLQFLMLFNYVERGWKDENEKFLPRFDDRENIKNMSERKKRSVLCVQMRRAWRRWFSKIQLPNERVWSNCFA